MKKNIIVLLLCFTTESFTQAPSKLKLLQGIWDYTMNSDTSKSYKVVSGKKCLEFGYIKSDNDLDFTLFEMIIGFQSFATKYDETEFIHIDSLKENGLYFTEIVDTDEIGQDGFGNKAFCMIASYYECDGELLSINGGKLFEYGKVPKLPNEAIKKLYNRGKHDNRNYIKDYIGIDVKEIKDAKTTIYSKPETSTKIRLLKGDLVTIVMQEGEWCKIEFEKNEIVHEGWIMNRRIK